MTISIIIPTLNEVATVGKLITYLQQISSPNLILEILVVDGGSWDDTRRIAETAGARVVVSARGRAVQMNTGARVAQGDILYFLHADTYPPSKFANSILNACLEGYQAGSFRHRFDDDHLILRLTSWIVNDVPRINFGDQSLFVLKSTFRALGGFDEGLKIMEDVDLSIRLRRHFRFQVVDEPVITSARKFHENGELRLLLIFALIYLLYEINLPQPALLSMYRALIRQNKI